MHKQRLVAAPDVSELEARLGVVKADPSASPEAWIDAHNALAWALKGREVQRAHALARVARERARDAGYTLGQARAARTMAMTAFEPSQIPAVLDLAHEARDLFDEAGDEAGRAGSRDFLSSLYEYLGDGVGALELALEALEIARRLGDPVRIGYASSSVGGLLSAAGETERAIGHLEEALELFEGVGDAQGVGVILSRISKAFETAGRDEEALEYAETCRDMGVREGDEWLLANARAVMGDIEVRRGRPDEAEVHYRGALLSLDSEAAMNTLGSEIKVRLARVLLERGAHEEAAAVLEDVVERIRGDTVSFVTEAEAHELLAEVRESQGTLEATVRHLRAAMSLRERIAQRDTKSKLAQLELRAAKQAAEKDAEIHKLRYVELQSMQVKLVESERMALLGKLAAGTAHEINTPLGVLRSNAAVARRATDRLLETVKLAAGPKEARLVETLASVRASSETALERIDRIVGRLERFAQLDRADKRTFDLGEGLESAVDLLRPTLPPGVVVELERAPLPPIVGWPRELNHAFMTVLQNAAQAIDGQGVIRASAACEGDMIRVQIRDTGRGMSEAEVAGLFDVGFGAEGGRSKMRFGLSAARATLERHGGHIEVESAPGRGTAMSFVLPSARTS